MHGVLCCILLTIESFKANANAISSQYFDLESFATMYIGMFTLNATYSTHYRTNPTNVHVAGVN